MVGRIKNGSAEDRIVAGQPETHFALVDEHGNELDIVYRQSRPDPFKEGREAIAEGTLDDKGVLQCDRLTVKCPSKYQSEDGIADRPADYYENKYGGSQGLGGS